MVIWIKEPLGITGLVFAIFGILLLIAGTVWIYIDKYKTWYIWTFIAVSILFIFLGLLFLIIIVSQTSNQSETIVTFEIYYFSVNNLIMFIYITHIDIIKI